MSASGPGDDHATGDLPMIAVEGVLAGDGAHRVFGFEMPQVPRVGECVEHPHGVSWHVVAVRWRVADGAPDRGAVTAVLVVDPE